MEGKPRADSEGAVFGDATASKTLASNAGPFTIRMVPPEDQAGAQDHTRPYHTGIRIEGQRKSVYYDAREHNGGDNSHGRPVKDDAGTKLRRNPSIAASNKTAEQEQDFRNVLKRTTTWASLYSDTSSIAGSCKSRVNLWKENLKSVTLRGLNKADDLVDKLKEPTVLNSAAAPSLLGKGRVFTEINRWARFRRGKIDEETDSTTRKLSTLQRDGDLGQNVPKARLPKKNLGRHGSGPDTSSVVPQPQDAKNHFEQNFKGVPPQNDTSKGAQNLPQAAGGIIRRKTIRELVQHLSLPRPARGNVRGFFENSTHTLPRPSESTPGLTTETTSEFTTQFIGQGFKTNNDHCLQIPDILKEKNDMGQGAKKRDTGDIQRKDSDKFGKGKERGRSNVVIEEGFAISFDDFIPRVPSNDKTSKGHLKPTGSLYQDRNPQYGMHQLNSEDFMEIFQKPVKTTENKSLTPLGSFKILLKNALGDDNEGSAKTQNGVECFAQILSYVCISEVRSMG